MVVTILFAAVLSEYSEVSWLRLYKMVLHQDLIRIIIAILPSYPDTLFPNRTQKALHLYE